MKNLDKIHAFWHNNKGKLEDIHTSENKIDHFYLSKFVEDLIYYDTMDEGYELFQGTCSLAYQMYGLGYSEQALLLVYWAAEQARESKEWMEDENDFAHGVWGY